MKEIVAILRPGKARETKAALEKVGVLTCTTRRVFGRGKQRGLKYADGNTTMMKYLPKKMLILIVNDAQARAALQAIIKANQTGQFGDGKIFVRDIEEAFRIRTGEKGEAAVR